MLAISTPPIFMFSFVPAIRFLFLSVMLPVMYILDPLVVVILVAATLTYWYAFLIVSVVVAFLVLYVSVSCIITVILLL